MVNENYDKPHDTVAFPAAITAADGETILRRFRVEGIVYAASRESAQSRIEQASIYLEAATITTPDRSRRTNDTPA